MKIRVKISQEKAILAGQNRWGGIEMDIDVALLTEPQRVELAVSQKGEGYLSLDNGTPTIETVIATLEALSEKRKEEKARHEEKQKAEKAEAEKEKEEWVQEYLAMPQSEFTDASDLVPRTFKGIRHEALDDPRLAEKWDIRNRVLSERAAANEKEEAERRAKAQAEEEANKLERQTRQVERRKQLDEWVRDNGTPNQQARYTAGLLPEEEIVTSIQHTAYQSLRKFEPYQNLTKSEVCDCEYENCNVTFTVEEADEATADEWENMLAIKEALQAEHPTASVTLRTHTGEGYECENTVTHNGIRVKIQVGVLKFEQEYEPY